MKSVLILGSTGMLGYGVLSCMVKYKNIKIGASVRSKKTLRKVKKNFPYNKVDKFHIFDVLNFKDKELNELVKNYDFIINCIGIIKPEINISNTISLKNAIFINSVFPNLLADTTLNKKIKIFQIATDCVYSGRLGKYNEKSEHDDTDIYGVTKSLGEIKKKNFFNLRTSIIGREYSSKKSLLEWFLNHKNKSTLNGFENHYWNGLTTITFGEIIYTIIENNLKIPNTFHIVPKDTINKYDLLQIFNKKFNTKYKIEKFRTQKKIDRSLKTVYKKKLNQIWKLSKFKSQPSIKDMINQTI